MTTARRDDGAELVRGAWLDGPYRYLLWRRWADAASVLFVMLNPSTADALRDDPTIRRCLGYARAWGFGAVEVVNLFAWRATDPRELRRAGDPVGPGNDRVIAEAAARNHAVIAAWGLHGALLDRGSRVAALLAPFGARCLGATAAGMPRHPLYLRATAATTSWPTR